MGKVYYVKCELCQKEYYLDKELYEVILSNPKQKLICPFCKKKFLPKVSQEGYRMDKTI